MRRSFAAPRTTWKTPATSAAGSCGSESRYDAGLGGGALAGSADDGVGVLTDLVGDMTGAGTGPLGSLGVESADASGTACPPGSTTAAFFALGRAGCVGRLARPGERVARRFLGTELVGLASAVFFGAFSAVAFVVFRALLGRFFAAFLGAFSGAFVERFFVAFFGAFVDARLAAGHLLVFFVAIASPEPGTLSESSRLATATLSLSSRPRTRTRCVQGVPAPSRPVE